MFRCPNCAKVHKIFVNNEHSILSNSNMDVFWFIKEPFYEGNLAAAFNNMLFKMDTEEGNAGLNEHGVQVVSDEDVCKCSLCDHVALFEEFHNAHVTPIDYFDAEELCHCGTELWMDRIPGTNRFGLLCDNCGWVKPDSVVSGSADSTSK